MVSSDVEVKRVTERMANRLLVRSMSEASSALDSFASWVFAISGTGMALVLSNAESLSRIIFIESIKLSCVVFLLAAVFATLQKWFAVRVKSAQASSDAMIKLGEEASEKGLTVDIEELTRLAAGAQWRWKRMSRSRREKLDADPIARGRMCVNWAGFQSIVMFVQLLLTACCFGLLIHGIGLAL